MEDGCVRARVIEVDSGATFEIAPNLPGRFQLQNALNAVATARLLHNRGFQIIDDAVMRGIAETVWPGRLEKLQSHPAVYLRSEEHTSELQSHSDLVCRLLLEKKNKLN